MVLDCTLQLLQQLVVEVAAVQSQRSELTFVLKRLQECLAGVLVLLEVVVREEEISESSVGLKTSGKKAKGVLRHLVVAHVDLLDVAVLSQSLGDWLDLFVAQLVFKEVQILERKHLEELGQVRATNLIIIYLDVSELVFS